MLYVFNSQHQYVARVHFPLPCQWNRQGGYLGIMKELLLLFLHKNIEAPGDSNSDEYPQHMFLWRTDENYSSIIVKYPPYVFFWWAFIFCGVVCYHSHAHEQPSSRASYLSGSVSEASSSSLYCLGKQQRLWKDITDEQAAQDCRWAGCPRLAVCLRDKLPINIDWLKLCSFFLFESWQTKTDNRDLPI